MKTINNSSTNLKADHFPGFDYKASELSKFLAASDLFTILLKNGDIIHYTSTNRFVFHQWLTYHNIENIKIEG